MYLASANGVPTSGTAGAFPLATFDMHPDNNYYNVKGEYA